jgi:hypothetical protein
LRTDKTQATNTDTLEPLDAAGNPIDAPFTVVDPSKSPRSAPRQAFICRTNGD